MTPLVCCVAGKVEGGVMGSPSENILKHSFGGTYSNELLAEGGLYSERPEPFSFISVEVRSVAVDDGSPGLCSSNRRCSLVPRCARIGGARAAGSRS